MKTLILLTLLVRRNETDNVSVSLPAKRKRFGFAQRYQAYLIFFAGSVRKFG